MFPYYAAAGYSYLNQQGQTPNGMMPYNNNPQMSPYPGQQYPVQQQQQPYYPSNSAPYPYTMQQNPNMGNMNPYYPNQYPNQYPSNQAGYPSPYSSQQYPNTNPYYGNNPMMYNNMQNGMGYPSNGMLMTMNGYPAGMMMGNGMNPGTAMSPYNNPMAMGYGGDYPTMMNNMGTMNNPYMNPMNPNMGMSNPYMGMMTDPSIGMVMTNPYMGMMNPYAQNPYSDPTLTGIRSQALYLLQVVTPGTFADFTYSSIFPISIFTHCFNH